MQPTVTLKTFLGNAPAVEILRRAIARDRLPHAMIFGGPAGVGKHTLARLVAQHLNCLSPSADGACGRCSACARIIAGMQGRNRRCQVLKGEGFCGNCANCKLRMMSHPDIRIIEPEKTTISIEQVRELIGEIAFQPFEARYRVVIMDPAEQTRIEAQSSLLKTLEEPPSRTIIILVTTNPYVLLETIRSRSRLLRFGPIPQDQIERHLITAEGKPREEAAIAAAFSGGSLAAALEVNTREFLEIRDQALRFVSLLLRRGQFADASPLAAQAAKEKGAFSMWIESVMALLQDIYYAKVAAERIVQTDLREHLEALAGIVPRSVVVSVIEAIRKLKGELQFNVNRQLALEAVFLTLTESMSDSA
jgi:DNA polymerase III subunit delta'